MTEPFAELGALAAARLEAIAGCSEPGPGVTRLPFTPQHRAALEQITEWMEDAGLRVSLDAAGTLIGRQEGPVEGTPVLLFGSHQDSVRQGGRFDGILGVALPVLALKALRDAGTRLPFAVEVLAFADEEGVRFPTALLGPRALSGRLDMAVLEMRDPGGVRLVDAMAGFGLAPQDLPLLSRDPVAVAGYVELHIEQGPVLEAEAQALGVVSAICGIERHSVTLTGEAAHAGTVPMHLRRDALAGAAEMVGMVEALGQGTEGLLATVGALDVRPGVVNAVPGEVRLTVELRAPLDTTREAAGRAVAQAAADIAARRGLRAEQQRSYAQPAVQCDPAMVQALVRSVQAGGDAGRVLASGATHDASAMADLCPVGMMFLRCRGGVSHNPAEHVEPADMAAAIAALAHFLAYYRPVGTGR